MKNSLECRVKEHETDILELKQSVGVLDAAVSILLDCLDIERLREVLDDAGYELYTKKELDKLYDELLDDKDEDDFLNHDLLDDLRSAGDGEYFLVRSGRLYGEYRGLWGVVMVLVK